MHRHISYSFFFYFPWFSKCFSPNKTSNKTSYPEKKKLTIRSCSSSPHSNITGACLVSEISHFYTAAFFHFKDLKSLKNIYSRHRSEACNAEKEDRFLAVTFIWCMWTSASSDSNTQMPPLLVWHSNHCVWRWSRTWWIRDRKLGHEICHYTAVKDLKHFYYTAAYNTCSIMCLGQVF